MAVDGPIVPPGIPVPGAGAPAPDAGPVPAPILNARSLEEERRRKKQAVKKRAGILRSIYPYEAPKQGAGGADGGPMEKISHNLSYKDEANLAAIVIVGFFSAVELMLISQRYKLLEQTYQTALAQGVAWDPANPVPIYASSATPGELDYDREIPANEVTMGDILRNNLLPPPSMGQAFNIWFAHLFRDMYSDKWLSQTQKDMLYGVQQSSEKERAEHEDTFGDRRLVVPR